MWPTSPKSLRRSSCSFRSHNLLTRGDSGSRGGASPPATLLAPHAGRRAEAQTGRRLGRQVYGQVGGPAVHHLSHILSSHPKGGRRQSTFEPIRSQGSDLELVHSAQVTRQCLPRRGRDSGTTAGGCWGSSLVESGARLVPLEGVHVLPGQPKMTAEFQRQVQLCRRSRHQTGARRAPSFSAASGQRFRSSQRLRFFLHRHYVRCPPSSVQGISSTAVPGHRSPPPEIDEPRQQPPPS